MTVKHEVKAERRRIQADQVQREFLATGRTAYEQFKASPAGTVAPIHRRINERAEATTVSYDSKVHAALTGMVAGALQRVAAEQPILRGVGPASSQGIDVEFNGEPFVIRVDRRRTMCERDSSERCGSPAYCAEHGCQL